ncbi:hypothetical protein QBC43DRAFT_290956 [Cladorrhinum sp. PSN259]|nr:hypothetical protein QBC43DRAFT_290956 [Cladorrhinum sp. PSN259]
MRTGIISLLLAGLAGITAAARLRYAANGSVAPQPAGVVLYTDVLWEGYQYMVPEAQLEGGKCANVPHGIRVLSVEKPDNHNKWDCCLLYRSPCPTQPRKVYAQAHGLLHQRMWDDIADLRPFGFDSIVRSVVCPGVIACTGLRSDWVSVELKQRENEVENARLRLEPYWVNLQHVPGHENCP